MNVSSLCILYVLIYFLKRKIAIGVKSKMERWRVTLGIQKWDCDGEAKIPQRARNGPMGWDAPMLRQKSILVGDSIAYNIYWVS